MTSDSLSRMKSRHRGSPKPMCASAFRRCRYPSTRHCPSPSSSSKTPARASKPLSANLLAFSRVKSAYDYREVSRRFRLGAEVGAVHARKGSCIGTDDVMVAGGYNGCDHPERHSPARPHCGRNQTRLEWLRGTQRDIARSLHRHHHRAPTRRRHILPSADRPSRRTVGCMAERRTTVGRCQTPQVDPGKGSPPRGPALLTSGAVTCGDESR